MTQPFFSVVIPVFNRKRFFKSCLDSVLNQTFEDFDVYVIDDGSTDGTITLMAEYINRGINYIRVKHGGVSYARNIGINLAKSEYIAFLDSDDKWDKRKLEITFNYINNYPEVFVFHTDEIWFKNGMELKQRKKHKKPSGYVYKNCLPLCCVGMSTSVVKKVLFDEVGLFDENLPACEDYDLWLRICSKYKIKLIPEPLTIKFGGRDDQLSSQPGLDKYRIYSLEKILSSNILNAEKEKLTRKEIMRKCKIYANGAKKRGKLKEFNYYLGIINKYSF